MADLHIWYLSTCSTCNRILKELGLENHPQLQDIKTQPMTEKQVDQMKALAGSYEALFSRRAMKYKELGLNTQSLKEDDYKNYILQEYTFLKRPVFILENKIFVGNSKKTVEALKQELNK